MSTDTPDPDIQYYHTPRTAWDAMYEACQAAQTSIDFEQYILKDDVTGLRFLDLFRDKARSGIRIRLMLDRVGSRSIFASGVIRDIETAGGRVHFYNQISPLNFLTPRLWFPRNHSKLMLVDSKIAFVGSVCVSHDMADWRDLHARITGDTATDISDYFNHLWQNKIGDWRRRFAWLADRKIKEDRDLSFIAAQSRLRSNAFYKMLLKQINAARDTICLATPYFMPPFLLKHALYHAAARGVDVQVMMSARSDVPIADYVAQSYFSVFLDRGFKIFLYRDSVFHAKYAIVDNSWSTLGSTNMDYLSLLRNREANIIIRNRPNIEQLKKHFVSDQAHCFEVDEDYCQHRPLFERFAGQLARPLKQFL